MTAVIVNFLFWFCPHFVGLKTLLSVYKVLVFGNLVTILAKLQQMLFIRQNTIMIYIGYQSVEILILILLLSVQKKTIVYFDIYTWPLYVSYSVGFRWKPFNLINSLFHESQERQNQSFVQSRLLWRLQSVWWPRYTCFILLLHFRQLLESNWKQGYTCPQHCVYHRYSITKVWAACAEVSAMCGRSTDLG